MLSRHLFSKFSQIPVSQRGLRSVVVFNPKRKLRCIVFLPIEQELLQPCKHISQLPPGEFSGVSTFNLEVGNREFDTTTYFVIEVLRSLPNLVDLIGSIEVNVNIHLVLNDYDEAVHFPGVEFFAREVEAELKDNVTVVDSDGLGIEAKDGRGIGRFGGIDYWRRIGNTKVLSVE